MGGREKRQSGRKRKQQRESDCESERRERRETGKEGENRQRKTERRQREKNASDRVRAKRGGRELVR